MDLNATFDHLLFSKEERDAFVYIGIHPTEPRYRGVLPEYEIVDRIVEKAQSLLDRKYDLFKRAYEVGLISARDCRALRRYYEKDTRGSSKALEQAAKAEGIINEAELPISDEYKTLYQDQEDFARHCDVLQTLIESKKTSKSFN